MLKAFMINLLLLPLGCFGGSTPRSPAPAQAPPEQTDPAITAARDEERRRRRAAAAQTILTGPQGVTAPAATAGKSLLGQ